MKRIFRISLYAFLLLAGAACTRHKIIPDEKLAQIFHDAFLTNAYIGDERVNIDSLNIYEPIFARYGYTTRDVYSPIGNCSKRKSARLGDVGEMAIEKLETEGKFYDREVAVLDTIDNVARRTFTRTVYADSLIRVGALRDTARLRIAVDVQPASTNCGSNTSSTRSTGTRRGCGASSGSKTGTAGAAVSIPRRCAVTGRRISPAVSRSTPPIGACTWIFWISARSPCAPR
ncbi:MAG: hypothetical protein ACLR93_03340 [Alistipes onderdonkii]